MDRSLVAIIIPALNEAGTIAGVVERVGPFGTVVVVDDGSHDDTARLARGSGAEVVSHVHNLGYDGALNSGFARAAELGCSYAVTCDADGQHNPQQIPDFIALLDSGYDLVLGVRDRTQRFGERIFSIVARRLWGMSDPLCGMKGYRMHLYRRRDRFDTFRSIGTELAVRSVVRGAKMVERHTIVRDRIDAPRFARTFAANVKILRALVILVALSVSGALSR